MSLDNVLAIGALAHGNVLVLGFGLLVSIALVLAGSALVAGLIRRLPWLLDVAALVLGWTAASMVLHDLRLGPVLHNALPYAEVLLYALKVVLAADVLFACETGRQPADRNASDDGPAASTGSNGRSVVVVFGNDLGIQIIFTHHLMRI